MREALLSLLLIIVCSCFSVRTTPPIGQCLLCETVRGSRETYCWYEYINIATIKVSNNSKEKSTFFWIDDRTNK